MAEEATLRVGDKAPEFRLPTGDGGELGLADLRGRHVVLYFYPRDDTPGCTAEACSFRDLGAEFAAHGATIVGISADTVASHRRFAGKHRLNFPLLADQSAEVAKAYGVYKLKSRYGRTSWGVERTTFLIDGDGVIRAVYPKVKVDGHADQVLKDLEEQARRSDVRDRERLAAIREEIEAIMNERTAAWASLGQQLAPIPGKEGDPEQIAQLEADDERARLSIEGLEAERRAILARLAQNAER